MPKATLVSSEHGFDDYDVEGIPTVHRVTVGHGIRKGDHFNVYCDEGRKIGGVWQGTLEQSLRHVTARLASETPDPTLSEITEEVVYLANATGDYTGYGTLEVTDEDLDKVPFERGPGVVLAYLTEIAGRKYVQGNLEVAFKDDFWGTDGGDYDSQDDVIAYCESVRAFLFQRMNGGALVLPLDKGDPGRIVVQVAVPLESVTDSDDALRKLNDLFGTAADEADVADLADRPFAEGKQPDCVLVYQPEANHMPADLLSSEVYLSLAEGTARHPEVPSESWLELNLGDIENATILDAARTTELKLPKTAPQERDIELCILGAQTHGECDDPDHEVGDLQDCLREMWQLMTPAQQQAFMASDSVRDRLKHNLPEEIFTTAYPDANEPKGAPTQVRKTVIQFTVLHDDGQDLSSISLRDIAYECDEGGYVSGGLAVVFTEALTRHRIDTEAARIGADASFFDIDPEEDSTLAAPSRGM
ncbi:hypothetical protein VI03_25695 [Burkholderia vietnamiensis]|nr:hypothetical protein VI03_25695 [Burkholderia vietnamiensis]